LEESAPSFNPAKPLGMKAYGSICHLPGSRLGVGDHKLNEGQTRILTERPRDKHDVVIVQEKLDGSNVAVARVNGVLIPLGRAGYAAVSSKYEQHRLFAAWAMERECQFAFLAEGERLSGEWLAQAHGTRYKLAHDPFVAFDLIRGSERASFAEFLRRIGEAGFVVPRLLSSGPPVSVKRVMEILEGEPGDRRNGFHGAIDPVEGAVWRVERKGKVDFLGKYVRPEKVDGCHLPEISGAEAVWNWRPGRNAEGRMMNAE
jgi:hypothetical protein